jgi:hypothetical protein
MKGQYYGAGQTVQNAFTALVQQQRTVIDGNNSVLGQFQDYYPWSDEAFTFNPPLGYLSNAEIALSNNYGEPFTHLDDMNAFIITLWDSSTNISDGKGFGNLNFTITRDAQNVNFVSNGTNTIFARSDVRVGDEISFYQPVVSNVLNDPSTNGTLRQFLNTLTTNSVIVTDVFSITAPGIPVLDVAYSFNAVFKTTTFQNTLDVYTNLQTLINDPGLFDWNNIPIFPTTLSGLSGQRAIVFSDLSFYGYNIPGTFKDDYVVPIINLNMQAAYAFEIITEEADRSTFGKIIPK